MDPDAALDQLRALAARVQADQRLSHSDVVAAAEAFSALDNWLREGGFLPSAWHLSTCMAHDCRGGTGE